MAGTGSSCLPSHRPNQSLRSLGTELSPREPLEPPTGEKQKKKKTDLFGNTTTIREQDLSLPKGYNIVAGKLSFEISKVMGSNEIAPTLVAMDMQKLFVADGDGLRRLTLREGLRLFGYPETMQLNVSEKDGFDLLGNTVVVPVIKAVATRLINAINSSNE